MSDLTRISEVIPGVVEETRKEATMRKSSTVRGWKVPKEDIQFNCWANLETGEIHEIVIVIPTLPPSKNTYQRAHWTVQQSRYFKPWFEWFGAEYLLSGRLKIKGQVSVSIKLHFPDKRRRDARNYTCFPPLMDALVRLGIIEDDNSQVCRGSDPEPVIDGTSRTVVRIRKEA